MIEIKNLSFDYGKQKILENLNFDISSNIWVSIMGNNGSGKTTLAKVLVGLLGPYQGNIFINNINLSDYNLLLLRSKISMIFQNPDYQFIGQTVVDDITFSLANQNIPREEIIQRVYKYSEMVGINDLLYKKPQELSGGQKQKVAIASILAMQPEIIIFDEVTAFLDPKGKKEIEQIIKQIKNKIIITITHNLDFAFQSDEIIFLEKGKLVKKDKPEIFFKDQFFLNKYKLEIPLALKLYYELQKDRNILKEKKINNIALLDAIQEALWLYNLKK